MSDIMDAIRSALEEKEQDVKFKRRSVLRSTDKSVRIPEGMTYRTARRWLKQQEEAEETSVNVNHTISCYPLDGALAFSRVLHNVYGYAQGITKEGFFGPNPPSMIGVSTGPGPEDMEYVPWGVFRVPGFGQDEELATGYGLDSEGMPAFVLNGTVRRKHEEAVAEIARLVKEEVRHNSIYQGKALMLDLEWMRRGSRFHPEQNAPSFMDLSGTDREQLILNPDTDMAVKANIFSRLERTEQCLEEGINLSTGVLLAGEYGTGKTLTARITAKIAEENGWTFFYLRQVEDLAAALRLSDLYERPDKGVVVFAEDVDRATGGGRDADLDEILNTIDGMDRKQRKTVTIVTTNHPERINRAMKRAGRISNWITLTHPEGDTTIEFVRYYSGDSLAPAQDFTELAQELSGFPPSFIEAACDRARVYAVHEHGSSVGNVTAETLINAARSYKEHVAAVIGEDEGGMTAGEALLEELDESTRHIVRQEFERVYNGGGEEQRPRKMYVTR